MLSKYDRELPEATPLSRNIVTMPLLVEVEVNVVGVRALMLNMLRYTSTILLVNGVK
jgi:hypothetical protein